MFNLTTCCCWCVKKKQRSHFGMTTSFFKPLFSKYSPDDEWYSNSNSSNIIFISIDGCRQLSGNNKVLNYNEELKKLTNYFNVENVSQIAWAHAVNNKTYLQQCLTDSPQTMMLEADILVSLKTNSIIMAHPKLKENNGQEFWDFNVESDLTFEEFVTSIDTFNFNAKYKKGMKLDFKQPSVVSK